MSLPVKLPYDLLVNAWAQQLNPIIANPFVQGLPITSISLVANVPKVIPTGLSRMQQGWTITDKTQFADVKRTQPYNSQNLTLLSDADTTIAIWVF